MWESGCWEMSQYQRSGKTMLDVSAARRGGFLFPEVPAFASVIATAATDTVRSIGVSQRPERMSASGG